jgi:3-phosphoshikimate 1-carboxyvinyltransferase
MARLGAAVQRDGCTVNVCGTAGVLRAPDGPLDLGNSGTGMRLLAGVLAGQPFVSELTGDSSLCSRPMRRIQEPLEQMGAEITLTGARGCAPMRVRGGALRPIEYALPMASAQVKSCVLLAGLFAEGETAVIEPRPTRDHTERLLQAMGVPVEVDGLRVSLRGGRGAVSALAGCNITVPGDFSSAAFWLTAAACRPGWSVEVADVGLNPRRTALLDVLKRMNADVTVDAVAVRDTGEPVGTVTVRGSELRATEVCGDEIPNLIDELPLVMVAGAFADGTTVIRDAAELRVKETDRIAVMADVLHGFGVDAQTRPDGMLVRGGGAVRARCESFDSRGDHRVAMCAAVLGLLGDCPVRVCDTACIATSYPTFADDVRRMGGLDER